MNLFIQFTGPKVDKLLYILNIFQPNNINPITVRLRRLSKACFMPVGKLNHHLLSKMGNASRLTRSADISKQKARKWAYVSKHF